MPAAPTISVCLFTGEPGPRVAATLRPLREVADEIVICADARAADADLAAYATVADRLFTAEFRHLEFHLQWLHDQCSCDWILRLDGDEVPSRALLVELPALVRDERVAQYRIPRAWLYPDTRHWLAEVPWWPDAQLRLVRNDSRIAFDGRDHTSAAPVEPVGCARAPLYHLATAIQPYAERWSRALRYDVRRPGLRPPGGGPMAAYYLPERFAEGEPRAVPPEDAEALDAALTAPAPRADRRSRRVLAARRAVPAAEIERAWAQRAIDPAAIGGLVELADPEIEAAWMEPGEERAIVVHVANWGTEVWTAGMDQPPHIRVGTRWWDADGRLVQEGRAPMPARVQPGEELRWSLTVTAPEPPGDYELELDIVLEDVAWTGSGARSAVTVRPPDARVLLRATDAGPKPGSPPLRIPKVIHQIWLGPAPIPQEHASFVSGWRRMHPEWKHRLWGLDEVAEEFPDSPHLVGRTLAEQADVLRYELLARYGGIYADTDVECLRPFDDLLGGVTLFAGLEVPGRLCSAVLGAVPGHQAFVDAARLVPEMIRDGGVTPNATATTFLTYIFAEHDDATVYPPAVFYPYLWDEPERRHDAFPGSWAVHHWTLSWKT